MSQKNYGIIIGFFAGILVMAYLIFSAPEEQKALVPGQVFNTTQAYILPVAETSYFPILKNNRPKPEINAKAALVYDLQSGRFLYSKESKAKVAVASLTKLMTAVIVKERLYGSEVVAVPSSAVKVDEEKQTLYLDEKLTVDELMTLMLVESSNDAAHALADYTLKKGFNLVEAMNQKAELLGMTDTTFKDPAGLSDEGYSSSEDLIKLVKYSLKHPSIWSTLNIQEVNISPASGISRTVKSTNQLLGTMPNILGGKTGYTEGALGCMILVVNVPGQEDKIISIVLGSTERFTDTKKLINWVSSAYRWE